MEAKNRKNETRNTGSPWNLPHLRKSIKVAFGYILLDDFHRCLENPDGFPTATTGPAAVLSTAKLKTDGRPFTQKF
jgi:hypothetical protein